MSRQFERKRSNLETLLLEPRADLLQLVRQVGQRRPHQLLLVLVARALANHLAVPRDALHLVGNEANFALQLLDLNKELPS